MQWTGFQIVVMWQKNNTLARILRRAECGPFALGCTRRDINQMKELS